MHNTALSPKSAKSSGSKVLSRCVVAEVVGFDELVKPSGQKYAHQLETSRCPATLVLEMGSINTPRLLFRPCCESFECFRRLAFSQLAFLWLSLQPPIPRLSHLDAGQDTVYFPHVASKPTAHPRQITAFRLFWRLQDTNKSDGQTSRAPGIRNAKLINQSEGYNHFIWKTLGPTAYPSQTNLFKTIRTYGSILGWMNIHLPPILMFIRGFLGFDPQPSVQNLPPHLLRSTRFRLGPAVLGAILATRDPKSFHIVNGWLKNRAQPPKWASVLSFSLSF